MSLLKQHKQLFYGVGAINVIADYLIRTKFYDCFITITHSYKQFSRPMLPPKTTL